MKLKGSETEKNLLAAFAGESQARNRYTYFASVARNEGYQQIMAIFEETANQEKEHAKRFYKHLEGGDVEITAMYPAGDLGTTADNLLHAAMGEKHEHSVLYPTFAKIARKEGFKDVAATFEAVSVAEKHHEKRYLDLLNTLKEKSVFKKAKPTTWTCRNCGYVHKGDAAPKICPACKHEQAYFQLLCEKF